MRYTWKLPVVIFYVIMLTLLKSKFDTSNGGLDKVSLLKHGRLGVSESMLTFRGVIK